MAGLEALSPLLDLGLVELMLRVPPEANFDPVLTRPLVREALRGALPPAVLARRDKGDFSALQHRTLSRPRTCKRSEGCSTDAPQRWVLTST